MLKVDCPHGGWLGTIQRHRFRESGSVDAYPGTPITLRSLRQLLCFACLRVRTLRVATDFASHNRHQGAGLFPTVTGCSPDRLLEKTTAAVA